MAEGPVFLDTSGLLALIRSRDGLHETAVRVMERLGAARAALVTSH